MAKPKRPKKVSYELIPRASDEGHRLYQLLDSLVEEHHNELVDARIAVAWCTSWKPDVDGRVTLGKCRKASDLDRELQEFDFIILLSKAFWQSERVTFQQRQALLDHELSHATVKYDKTGEPEVDERGRTVYRVRKHDLEEFAAIVERHGLYKHDLELFAQALARHIPEKRKAAVAEGNTHIAACGDCGGTTWRPVVVAGVEQAERCHCVAEAAALVTAAEATL